MSSLQGAPGSPVSVVNKLYVPRGKRYISGAVLLLEQDGLTKFLVVKERSWPKCDRKWGIPKGKREGEESPWDCMVREVREEVGIDLLKIPITVIGRCRRARTYIVFIVLHSMPLIKIQRREIKTFRWVTPQECYCVFNAKRKTWVSWITPQTSPTSSPPQTLMGNMALGIVTQNLPRVLGKNSPLANSFLQVGEDPPPLIEVTA
jgi:8-oxo-dGTP pyrophosphatase MutT (NUDIX family)